jgi:transcription elongation factor Elf1
MGMNKDYMKNVKLLPCPFCGSKPKWLTYGGRSAAIQCRKCGVGTNLYAKVMCAVSVWNKRAANKETKASEVGL